MKNDKLYPTVLAAKVISNVHPDLMPHLSLPKDHKSIGIITCDMDDPTYVALDAATKAAEVKVVYAKSMYAGSANASTKLQGEVIGIISGQTPDAVKSGMDAALNQLKDIHFTSASEDDSIPYFAHTISRTGSYLSELAGIREGEALAYLIAPPLEAVYSLDAALKAADVKLISFYGPPSETNFGGGLLTGTQSACKAAADAFALAVQQIANKPKEM
ncbi:MAG: ethanolamine utilization microcompartment protein EutL [Clostridia bacterium]|nr:ethanolamine utilization microcompartment protein EutL [Clostridia bacterium]